MAKKKNPDPALVGLPEKPVAPEGIDEVLLKPLRLTPEMKSRLEALGPAIEQSRKEIALMKKMKMDVVEAESVLEDSILKRKIMLENFG